MNTDNKMTSCGPAAGQSHLISDTGSHPIRLFAGMFAMIAVLAGCGQPEQIVDQAGQSAPVDTSSENQQPLGHVMEFDGYTLRANVIRTDDLDEIMAQQYGVATDPEHALLSLVILEKQPNQQPSTVWAEVTVRNISLVGRQESIEMRPIETLGDVSFAGILDASSQRIFKLDITAQPEGTDEQLQMEFEVRLDWKE